MGAKTHTVAQPQPEYCHIMSSDLEQTEMKLMSMQSTATY